MATAKKDNQDIILYRLDQMDSKLDEIKEQSKNYVTNERFDMKISELEDKIRAMQKARNFSNWVNPVIASISTALVTFLLIEYIRRS